MVQHMKSGSLMIQILLSGECKSKIIYTMLRVIWLTLSKNVVHNVAKEKSTVELMKVLLDMYEKLSANNKVFLIKKLFHLKMEEGVSMATHLNEFNMIVNQLSSSEIVFNNDVHALILLASLPNSWEPMRVTISKSVGSAKLKFNDVRTGFLLKRFVELIRVLPLISFIYIYIGNQNQFIISNAGKNVPKYIGHIQRNTSKQHKYKEEHQQPP